MSGHLAFRFVIAEELRFPVARQWFAIDLDDVRGGDIEGRTCQNLAIYTNTSIIDPGFRFASRTKAGAGYGFCNPHGAADPGGGLFYCGFAGRL